MTDISLVKKDKLQDQRWKCLSSSQKSYSQCDVRPGVFSLFSMPLLGYLSVYDNMTTSQTRLPVFSGCRLRSKSSLNLPSSSTALSVAWFLRTCLNPFAAHRRHSIRKTSSVVYFRRPFRAFVKTCVHRRSVVRCCRPKALEHSDPTTSHLHCLFLFSAIN